MAVLKEYKGVMFDLDGTIIDSGPGIMKSVQYALDHFGLQNQPASILRRFVGPSLIDSFTTQYGMSVPEAEQAVVYYREIYHEREMFNARLYDGIPEVLRQLKKDGARLLLVTSKPHVLAERIMEHFAMETYFDWLVGPELDDPSSQKARLIRRAMEISHLNKDQVIMVGDTRYDIEGAKEAGVASVGCTYGYGDPADLQRADFQIAAPVELLEKLG